MVNINAYHGHADPRSRFHERLRRFIKGEQDRRRSENQIPIRVTSTKTKVTLKGPASAVQALAEKVVQFVEQEKEDEKERGFTLSFDFPQKFANHLIGKGGSNIRDLRDKFDVEIQVQDGNVELKGPKNKAEKAKSHILSLGRSWADEATHTLKIDPKFHRELIGKEGTQINRLQDRYKVLIFFPRSAKATSEDQGDASSDMGKPKRQQAPDEVVVRGPSKGADGARDELLSLYQYLKDNSFTATVTIQQKQVPSLIGQGGSALEELRLSTGAKIDIPADRNVEMVEVQLKGTKEQVAAAKKVLEQKKSVFDDTIVRTIDVDRKHHKALIGPGGEFLGYHDAFCTLSLTGYLQDRTSATWLLARVALMTVGSWPGLFSSPSRTPMAAPSRSRAGPRSSTRSSRPLRRRPPSGRAR